MDLIPVRWLGSSLADVRRFPSEARQILGHQLHRVQCGMAPADWKPMPLIGPGVRELRVRTGRAWRVIYVVRAATGVCVLHAFEKRSQRTARADLDLARRRLRALDQHGGG